MWKYCLIIYIDLCSIYVNINWALLLSFPVHWQNFWSRCSKLSAPEMFQVLILKASDNHFGSSRSECIMKTQS